MRSLKFLTLLFLLSNNLLLFSQKLNNPNSINIKDFEISNFNKATILVSNTLVTFPYKIDNGEAGALDRLFSLRIEGVIRVCLPINESEITLAILPVIYGKEPKITSIVMYYQKGNSIITEKLKIKDLEISHDSTYYYCSLSKVIKSNASIIDVYYSCIISEKTAKERISFYLIKNLVYNDLNVQVLIPEIYSYLDLLGEPIVNIEIRENYPGPRIGYWSTANKTELICKALMEAFKEMFGSDYEAVYCKQNLISIQLKDVHKGMVVDSDKEIVNLKLMNINEIK